MVTVTVTITDTGKRSTSSVAAEETGTTGRANSGNAITLQCVELTYGNEISLNNTPTFNKMVATNDRWSFAEIDACGIETPELTIEGVLQWEVSGDRTIWGQLVSLSRTKGYKTLTATNTLVSHRIENATTSTINVRVKSLKATQTSNSQIIRYTMVLWETN